MIKVLSQNYGQDCLIDHSYLFSVDFDGVQQRRKATLQQDRSPGRRLINNKTQTPEEEQEITITITKFTKRMIEVERVVELHRIRLGKHFISHGCC